MSKKGAWKGDGYRLCLGTQMRERESSGHWLCPKMRQWSVSDGQRVWMDWITWWRNKKGFGVRTKDLLLVITGDWRHCIWLFCHCWRWSSSFINFQRKTTYTETLRFVSKPSRGSMPGLLKTITCIHGHFCSYGGCCGVLGCKYRAQIFLDIIFGSQDSS